MANQKHLDVLKQGVEVWNEWRKEYDKIRARDDEKKEDPEAERISLEVLYGKRPWKDFFKNVNTPDLSGADLSHTDLSYANFRRTNFNGANLRNATLNGVDFRKSLLCGANFQNADLADANLSGSFLIATDFSRADLGFANFSQAFFSFTNLSNSILFSTMFGDVDLRDSYGLETVEHVGPSIISIDTLVQSLRRYTGNFFTGCRMS